MAFSNWERWESLRMQLYPKMSHCTKTANGSRANELDIIILRVDRSVGPCQIAC